MSKNAFPVKHLPASVSRVPPPSTAPGPTAPPGKVGKTGAALKEVPCFVSKRQHSKRGKLEVHTRRPRRTLDCRRRRGRRLAQVRRVARSRLPYGPRRRAAARRRPLAPRRAAPWRGAPGRTAAVRRRVGARRPAPAGSSTITAPRAPPSRPRRPPPAARRPLPRGGDGEVRAPSPEECAWESARARAQQPRPRGDFASTLRLPGTRPPPTRRSTLRAPRLQPQCLSNSPAGVSHARLDCPLRSLLPKHRLPPPRPPQQPPRRLAPDQETGLRGRLGPRGTCHPRGQLSAVLCVRAARPSAERLPRRRLARKREGKEERGTTRGLEGGQKTTALTLGRFRHGAAFGLLLGLAPTPASPPRQGRGKGGRGRSGAAGAALEMVLPELQGRGSNTVLVSLRRFRGLEKGP